jgi:hypothetical protein
MRIEGLRAWSDRLLGLFALRHATSIILVRNLVRSALDLLEDAARLHLEPRWNEQLGRAQWIWVFALSPEVDGNALRLESAFNDLSLDQRMRREHSHEVFSHTPIMSRFHRRKQADIAALAVAS